MIDVNITAVYQVVNFVLLIFALNMLVYKPIRGVLAKRHDKVAGLEGSVEKAEKEVSKKNEDYNAGIKEARVKGIREKDSLIKLAEDEGVDLLKKINDHARDELKKIKENIKNDAREVEERLSAEVDVFAMAIGNKILGRII